MCLEDLSRAFLILPLGRCAASVRRAFEDIEPTPVWTGTVDDLPKADRVLVLVLDDRDEHHLAEVARARARWPEAELTTLMVVLGTVRAPDELHRVARHWNATVVAVPVTDDDALARVTASAVDGLLRIGFLCCDIKDFAVVLAPPAVGTCLTSAYEPLHGIDWRAPAGWAAAFGAAKSVILTIRMAEDSTLFDLQNVAQRIEALCPADANIYFTAPGIGPSADISVIGLSPVAPLP
jgi:hypothetical protein